MLPPLLLVALGGVIGYELLKGSQDGQSRENDGRGDGGDSGGEPHRTAAESGRRSGSVNPTPGSNPENEENEPPTQGKDNAQQLDSLGASVPPVRSGGAGNDSGGKQPPATPADPQTESVTDATDYIDDQPPNPTE